MGNGFISAPANREKTAWRRDINKTPNAQHPTPNVEFSRCFGKPLLSFRAKSRNLWIGTHLTFQISVTPIGRGHSSARRSFRRRRRRARSDASYPLRRSGVAARLIFRRPKLGELFLSAINIGFIRAAQLKEFLLATYVYFGSFKLGALALCHCDLRGFG